MKTLFNKTQILEQKFSYYINIAPIKKSFDIKIKKEIKKVVENKKAIIKKVEILKPNNIFNFFLYKTIGLPINFTFDTQGFEELK